jgi:putative NADH-flavin reductase
MNILVFGATGKTGHEVVRQSLSHGHHVNAYVRNPDKLMVNDPDLTLIKGELSDYEKIMQTLEGNDAVISTLGASSPFRYDQALVDGMANIVRAM